MFPTWHYIDNYDNADLGRIWILHDDNVKTHIFRATDQAIHVHVYSLALQKYFFMSIVYASNDYLARRSLWADLGEISLHASSDPWLIVGDFNVTLQMCERFDYMLGMPLSMKELDFIDYIDLTGITDIQSTGTYYTWSNKRAMGFLAKKLDKALGND